MPTYHFNIHRADEILIDDIGEELRDVQIARSRAIEISCNLFQQFPPREMAEAIAIEVQSDGRSVLRTLATVQVEHVEPLAADETTDEPDVCG